MLRLMREYSDTCGENYSHPSATTKSNIHIVSKTLPSTMETPAPAVTPIKIWSKEIKAFGSKLAWAKIFYPVCFSSVEAKNDHAGESGRYVIENRSHNNFHLIDRQYNELCRRDDIFRST